MRVEEWLQNHTFKETRNMWKRVKFSWIFVGTINLARKSYFCFNSMKHMCMCEL